MIDFKSYCFILSAVMLWIAASGGAAFGAGGAVEAIRTGAITMMAAILMAWVRRAAVVCMKVLAE